MFYATWYARLDQVGQIDSVHLLKALMCKEEFRANVLFRLREHFPLHCNCPSKFGTSQDVPKSQTVVANEVVRILQAALWEADMLGDYWIDTEHLLLGILKQGKSAAAEYLARTGLTLKQARGVVMENRGSRPSYGATPTWWKVRSPLDNWIHKWRMRRYRRENG